MTARADNASFRDPSGRVLVEEDRAVRWVADSYRPHYDAFHHSPLSRELRDRGWLLDYRELDEAPPGVYRVLESERIPFVSYPYEWPFSAFKAAALLTLDLQIALLQNGFVLKDATPFNVQFRGSRPVFIDLLSFEVLEEGRLWMAYRQFCEMFLAPLLLMARVDLRLSGMLRTHLDGVPLDLAAKLLPLSAKLRPGTWLHVVLHARLGRSDRGGEANEAGASRRRVTPASLQAMARQLRSMVEGLDAELPRSLWSDYYGSHLNYTEAGFRQKQDHLHALLRELRPATVWDLGSNTGVFSRICAEHGAYVVAFDSDPAVVEGFYRDLQDRGPQTVLPLWVDLTNPSPGIGWANRERGTLLDRATADLTLALGLIHHLRLTHNVPFEMQAEHLARCGRRLLVEWVPADDAMTRRLARNKKQLLGGYTEERFLEAFGRHFRIEPGVPIEGSGRKLFSMQAS